MHVWLKLASLATPKRLWAIHMKIPARNLCLLEFLHRDWQRRWARWWHGPPLAGVSGVRVLHRPTRNTGNPSTQRRRGWQRRCATLDVMRLAAWARRGKMWLARASGRFLVVRLRVVTGARRSGSYYMCNFPSPGLATAVDPLMARSSFGWNVWC